MEREAQHQEWLDRRVGLGKDTQAGQMLDISTNGDTRMPPVGILILNRHGVVQDASVQAVSILGVEAGDLIGQPFSDIHEIGEQSDAGLLHAEGMEGLVGITSHLASVSGEACRIVTLLEMGEFMQLQDNLRELALHDDLTGLYNRRGFFALAEQHLRLAQRIKQPFLILFADVDNLKRINDSHGHPAGDRALLAVTAALAGTFRDSDIIARIGGDEFVVLPIDAPHDSHKLLSDRLQKSLDSIVLDSSLGFEIALSVGEAPFDPDSPASIDALLEQADASMYSTKKATQDATE